jgi:hypothetical protein
MPCAGAALALSFPRTHPLLTGVLKANVVSMLAVLAWIYTVTPVRLCNSYLATDQKTLGKGMAVLVCVLAIRWGVGLLFGGNAVRFGPGYRQPDHMLHAADQDFNSVVGALAISSSKTFPAAEGRKWQGSCRCRCG